MNTLIQQSAQPRLVRALRDWQTDAFEHSLKRDLLALEQGAIPLSKGVTQGGYVDDSNIEVTLLSASEDAEQIVVRVGVFFSEIIAGCSCGDDPAVENAYCEMYVHIDKKTAEASFIIPA